MGTIFRIPPGQENVELVERADEPIKLKFKKRGDIRLLCLPLWLDYHQWMKEIA